MIDFAAFRNNIRTGLQTYLRNYYAGILVIQINPDAGKPKNPATNKPALPYMTMNFTSPYIPEGMQAIETIETIPHPGPNWSHDIEYTRHSNDTMSASWNVYDNDIDRAHSVALRAQQWFAYDGLDYLRTKGVVVVSRTAVQNRDVFLVDQWDRRLGFDVIFRVLSEIKRVVPTIESADIERK